VRDKSILYFSDIYRSENLRQELSGQVREVDLSGVDGTCCYCDPDSVAEIRDALACVPVSDIHFIDTGDYHYISLFFCEKINSPFDLLLFDRHPDTQQPQFDNILSCGSWVRELIERQVNLGRVYMVGTAPALRDEAAPFGEKVQFCDTLEDVPEILGNVYVSIDKDVLSRDVSVTDWDQGEMSLEMLGLFLGAATAKAMVIGADICGGLAASKGGTEHSARINLKSDLKVAALLDDCVR
jgi:hypothetical protein